MVGQFLNGDLGPLDSVDPHFAALLYAATALSASNQMVDALAKGGIVLTDDTLPLRWHTRQRGRLRKKRAEFRAWIEHLEYGIYGLPKKTW